MYMAVIVRDYKGRFTKGTKPDNVFQKGHQSWLGKKRKDMTGEKHFNWKGGRIKMYGYWWIRDPNNPMATTQGYVKEHRLIMSKSVGRPLKKSEIVHHINGDKEDNRIENLIIVTINTHNLIHNPKILKKCLKCNKYSVAKNLCSKHYQAEWPFIKRTDKHSGYLDNLSVSSLKSENPIGEQTETNLSNVHP